MELSPKLVTNEPVKKRLFSDELVVMDRTSEAVSKRPPNSGADLALELVSRNATAWPGFENAPPAQTLLLELSQKRALALPESLDLTRGPIAERAWKDEEETEAEATLLADVPLMDENEPAT